MVDMHLHNFTVVNNCPATFFKILILRMLHDQYASVVMVDLLPFTDVALCERQSMNGRLQVLNRSGLIDSD